MILKSMEWEQNSLSLNSEVCSPLATTFEGLENYNEIFLGLVDENRVFHLRM